MSKRWPLMLLVTAFSAPAAAETPQLTEVLERMIDAYGGAENLRKLDHVVQEWDFLALMGNRHGSDVRSVSLPGQLRVELTYPEKREVRVLNGDAAHVLFDDRPPALAQAPQRDAMRLQLKRLYSPLALRDRIGNLSMTAEGGLLALSLFENGLRVDYLVNPHEWRIEVVVGTLSINGGEMRFRTEYSDFAFVEGVLVHRAENKYAGSVNTAKLKLRRVQLGAEFGSQHFQP